MAATNSCGWVVEEYFSDVGWKQSVSFPDVYSTKEEAQAIMQKRLKGTREYRVYECLMSRI